MEHRLYKPEGVDLTPYKNILSDSVRKSYIDTTAQPAADAVFIEQLRTKNQYMTERVHELERELVRVSSHFEYSSNLSCKCGARYQQKIRDLKLYLGKINNSQIDKTKIMNIVGLNDYGQQVFMHQEQTLLKDLTHKITLLLKQNHRLRESQKKIIHSCIRCQDLSLENSRLRSRQVTITQCIKCKENLKTNSKLKAIIRDRERSSPQNQQNLINDNTFLKSKLAEMEQLLRAIQRETKTTQAIKNTQNGLTNINDLWNTELRQFYQNIEQRNQSLNTNLNTLQFRLSQTEKSLSHLKFEREVKIQKTVRKSKNRAEFLPKVIGDLHSPFQQFDEPRRHSISPTRFTYNAPMTRQQHPSIFPPSRNLIQNVIIRPDQQERFKSMQQRINRLFKDNEMLTKILRSKEEQLHQKIQRILALQTELSRVKQILQGTNVNAQPQAPTAENKAKSYSQDVKKIRQFLVSCNPTNFQKFQNEFKQIITQRNQLQDQLAKLKSSKNGKQKILSLQRDLSQAKKRTQQYQLQVLQLEHSNSKLKQKVQSLEREIDTMRAEEISSEIDALQKIKIRQPQGLDGLEWQKIVQNCIDQTASRLNQLESYMIEEYFQQGQMRERSQDILEG